MSKMSKNKQNVLGIQHNTNVRMNKERERERYERVLKDYNKDKIKVSRICKDCQTTKCIYNGKDEKKCKYYHMFNSLYLTKEKKERKKALTIESEEGKRYLESLPRVRV